MAYVNEASWGLCQTRSHTNSNYNILTYLFILWWQPMYLFFSFIIVDSVKFKIKI